MFSSAPSQIPLVLKGIEAILAALEAGTDPLPSAVPLPKGVKLCPAGERRVMAANPAWPHAGLERGSMRPGAGYGTGNGSEPSSCSMSHLSFQVQQLMASYYIGWTLGRISPPNEWSDAGMGAAGSKKQQFAESSTTEESSSPSAEVLAALYPLLVKYPHNVIVYSHSLQPRDHLPGGLCVPPM